MSEPQEQPPPRRLYCPHCKRYVQKFSSAVAFVYSDASGSSWCPKRRDGRHVHDGIPEPVLPERQTP
jgi:hypothetical protein